MERIEKDMKKILISGFMPFDQDLHNPSANWIKWFLDEEKVKVQEGLLKGVILPVTFEGAFNELKLHIDSFKPEVIIMTGLAKNRTELSLERIGINWVDFRIPDNVGMLVKAQKIDSLGPDGLFTTIPIDLLLSIDPALKISTSAGEYVCNELLYRTLYYLQDTNTQVTFFHLPGEENYKENYNNIFIRLKNLVRANE